MSNKDYHLIVVAHPDDETLFFSGVIQRLKSMPWKIICLTDGNADGRGSARLLEFESACKRMQVKEFERWDFPDIYHQRLDISSIVSKLAALDKPSCVYSHGILGEYGHPHHQDTAYAVHLAFNHLCPILVPAQNCLPDVSYELTAAEFKLKNDILSQIYALEFNKFAHLVPCTWSEGFTSMQTDEVETIYQFLIGKKNLDISKLKKFHLLADHIKQTFGNPRKRLF